ncbi:MAG: DNA replication/repair protein RecF [Vampirovibrionales bacterium]
MLDRLVLKNFRNFKSLALPLQRGWHVFLGENGQGKTNLLEAFVLLAWGKSHRQGLSGTTTLNKSLQTHPLIYHASWLPESLREDDRNETHADELPSVEALLGSTSTSQYPEYALIEAFFQSKQDTCPSEHVPLVASSSDVLRLRFEAQGKQSRLKASWNGKPFKRRGDLVGKVPCVAFFTEDLALLRGQPSDRREWLERAMLQWQPLYQDVFQTYQKVLKQRNELLHQAVTTGHYDEALLDVLTEQFIRVWWESWTLRLAYLETLLPWLSYYHQRLAHPHDGVLQCCYLPRLHTLGLREGVPHPLTSHYLGTLHEGTFREELKQRRHEELRRGHTVVGTHKDDILFWLGTQEHPWLVSQLGSQGQQRSVVLALKLAELAVLAQRCMAHQDPTPILLLDDVMAELDPERQAKLLLALNTHASPHTQQVFLTTTHLHPSTLLTLTQAHQADAHPLPVQGYQVRQGTVIPCPFTT